MSSLKEESALWQIPFEDILKATDNFSEENLLEQGGKADDYKGSLQKSEVEIHVIVRKYKSTHTSEFSKDLKALSCFKHRNFVSFIGFCNEKDERLIVMEHVVNGVLDKYLSDPTLTWTQRLYICFRVASAWSYWRLVWSYGRLKGYNEFFNHVKIFLDKDTEPKALICIDSMPHKLNSLGVILLNLLYGREVTMDDVDHFLTKIKKNLYGKEELPIFSGITDTCLNTESLSIFSRTAYRCLNGEHDYVVRELDQAFKFQWKHENQVEKFAGMRISLAEIKLPTDDFFNTDVDETVYKAKLEKFGRKCVLTRWNVRIIKSFEQYKNVLKDFFAEIELLSGCSHPNLLALLGFCDEGSEMILVFECDFRVTLDDYLSQIRNTKYGTLERLYEEDTYERALAFVNGDLNLTNHTWEQIIRMCLDLAHGLKYIHNNMKSKSSLVCGKLESSAIFLDEKWTAKIIYRLYKFNSEPASLRSGRGLFVDDIHSLGLFFSTILTSSLDYPLLVAREPRKEKYREWDETQEFSYKRGADQNSLFTLTEIKDQCLKETSSERLTLEDVIKSLKKALDFQNLDDVKTPVKVIRSATETFNKKSVSFGELYDAKVNHIKIKTIKDRLTKTTDIVTVRSIFPSTEEQRKEEFLSEVDVLSRYEHPNIVSLLGFCAEENEMLLLYEHCPNGSLDDYLRRTDNKTNLTWAQRLNMCLDIANGLNYLHTKAKRRIIYCNIRSANILFGENWKAMISDFGLYEFHHMNNQNRTIETDVYLDPEYINTGLSFKTSEIYSFGVVLFEIFSGKLAYDASYIHGHEDDKGLAPIAQKHFLEETLRDILDPKLKDEVSELCSVPNLRSDEDSFDIFSKIAYQCLAEPQEKRPTMQQVIEELKNALHYQDQQRKKAQQLKQLKIPLKDIKSATQEFGQEFFIGSGGYADVYRAELNIKSKHENSTTPTMVAIKRIRKDCQVSKEFLSEVDMLSRCEHPNIITLFGFCNEGNEMIQVYEYASEGSLGDCLGSPDKRSSLTWARRVKICIDIAQGLNYLHNTMEDKKGVIHRDIKSDNILFDKNWEAKIADFGLCKFILLSQQKSTINTKKIAGTLVYIDPEYYKTHKLKKASDIYSFGVVLFEIFTGTLAYDLSYQNEMGLAPVARSHFEKGTIKDMLDPKVMDEVSELGFTQNLRPDQDSLDAFLEIAHQCIEETQANRPTIKVVIKELKKALRIHETWTLKIPIEQLKSGTDNFSDNKCIITSGYGKLYQGNVRSNNKEKNVTVKRFLDKYFKNTCITRENVFLKEFEVLFKYKQENIIGLVGYCNEKSEKIIVYEHASKGSLNTYLNNTRFSWTERLKICIDIAKGLKFLHGGDGGQNVVIHRDLKSSNILLTDDWKAKICGFELALIYPTNHEIEYVENDVIGSPGYCDPLYLETRYNLTKESDIYSFGVILFELLCGRLACPEDFRDQSQFLDVLVKSHILEARLEEIVFEGIKEQIAPNSLVTFGKIAFQCLHAELEERPTATDVLVQLQIALEFQEAYETPLGAELKRNYEKLQQLSKFPERYSEMAKKFIYDILKNKILLENDKQEIIQAFGQTTGDLKQLEEDDNTHQDVD